MLWIVIDDRPRRSAWGNWELIFNIQFGHCLYTRYCLLIDFEVCKICGFRSWFEKSNVYEENGFYSSTGCVYRCSVKSLITRVLLNKRVDQVQCNPCINPLFIVGYFLQKFLWLWKLEVVPVYARSWTRVLRMPQIAWLDAFHLY